MTDDVIAGARDLLNRGESRRQIIEKLGIKYDTLRKAINQGRLRESSQLQHNHILLYRSFCQQSSRNVVWQSHRIACITYHKFPKENWPVEEFQETLVTLSCVGSGEMRRHDQSM